MIETERLVLRAWREADRAPFAELNADPEVRRYFPSVLTTAESDAEADRIAARLAGEGTTFWALERKADGLFLGFAGVVRTGPQLPFNGAPEIGWRLARPHWRQGYASEAAGAALRHAFNRSNVSEIVSFTATMNFPSQAVMRRIGMRRDPARDFDHPALPSGHDLARHVVFAIQPSEVA